MARTENAKKVDGPKVCPPFGMQLGKTYLIRAITYHYIGTLAKVDADYIRLDPAAWLADSGRFNAALRTGSVAEVEPFVDGVSVARQSVVDFTPWNFAVPTEVR